MPSAPKRNGPGAAPPALAARRGARPRRRGARGPPPESLAPSGPGHPSGQSGSPIRPPNREILRRLLRGTIPLKRPASRSVTSSGLRRLRRRDRAAQTSLVAASYDEAFSRVHSKIASGGLEALRHSSLGPSPSPSHLYAELLAHEAVEGLMQVHSTRRYASLALCELLLQKSQRSRHRRSPSGRAGPRSSRSASPSSSTSSSTAPRWCRTCAPSPGPISPTPAGCRPTCGSPRAPWRPPSPCSRRAAAIPWPGPSCWRSRPP